MTTLYPFGQFVDIDQGTGTDVRPFGSWYAPDAVTDKCYNALFGKGNYESADASLEGHWELQETSGTTISDSSGNGNTLATYNMGASPTTVTGPTSWLSSAIDWTATGQKIEGSAIPGLNGIGSLTLMAWCYPDASGSNVRIMNNGDSLEVDFYRGSSNYVSCYIEGSLATDTIGAFTQNEWHHHCVSYDGTNLAFYKDSGYQSLDPITGTTSISGSYFTIGNRSAGDRTWVGALAGCAAFSRSLSGTEIAEAYSGPEPYLSGTAPTITGTIGRGETITLNAGTWNGQSNGTVYYTYELYSYSDTSGTDERLEKRITTTLTTQKVILRGSAIVGRYLRAVITASNDGGFDPLEVYSTAYTSSVGTGSDPTYESYNALLGEGRHFIDPDVQVLWKCDEATGSSQLEDSSHNSNAGTPSSTAITSVTGPNSWLTKGIKFDTDGNAEIASPSINSTTPISMFAYHKWSGGNDDFILNKRAGAAGAMVVSRSIGWELYVYGTNATGIAGVSGSWKFMGASASGQTKNFLYDSSWYTVTSGNYLTNGNIPFKLGGSPYGPQGDEFANVGYAKRAFTQAEFEQLRDGPEPLNITAPSISGTATQGQTLTAAAGTWDSQSNGTVTASYVWYKADDTAGTNITQVGTGTTYTLQASDVGKYMILKERGTNDGGYDEAEDTYSAYTAVVAGGGGGATITAASGNYSLSGSAATLNEAKNVVSANGTYTYTGYTSAFNVSLSFVSAYGIYSVTGSVAGFLEEQVIISSSGNYVISGYTAGFPVQGDITGESGIYSISGSTANIILDEVIPSSSGTYTLSGQVATFNTAATTTFLLENGNYTYGGYYATWFVEDRVLIASPGNYTLSGKDMLFDVSAPSSIIGQTGTYTISGSAAYQVVSDRLVANSTTYTISGQAVNFNTAALVTFLAESGNYGISASSSTLLIHDRMILASPGNYQITGHDLYTVLENVIAANGGSYTVNGQEVFIRRIGFGSPYYYLLFRRL